MSIPVAMIPYTNMAPYRQLGPPPGCHFVPQVPRDSIHALLAGAVAAAAVPVGGLRQLTGRVETVGRYGIAADGPCMSVLLFSRVPFEAMHAPHTLRVTAETASSVRLLHLLMADTLGVDRLPRLAAAGQNPDGELLIGDQALIRAQMPSPADRLGHITDLAERWRQVSGLPFVFARWVVRRELPAALKTTLKQWLERFRENEARLVRQAVSPSARQLGLAPRVIARYFEAIRRCLDERDLQGQRHFLAQIERFAGQAPLFPEQ